MDPITFDMPWHSSVLDSEVVAGGIAYANSADWKWKIQRNLGKAMSAVCMYGKSSLAPPFFNLDD